jgi:hypothetical protein
MLEHLQQVELIPQRKILKPAVVIIASMFDVRWQQYQA